MLLAAGSCPEQFVAPGCRYGPSSVSSGLPGGDPSFLLVPPIEQFRSNYVFLTPDKYDFDFVRIIAPPEAVIVFDNQDSIAYISQAFQGGQQAGVVTRVQTNGWLIQDIKHTHQAGTDLGRQTDALGFTTR